MRTLLFFVLFLSLQIHAAIETYDFSTDDDRLRYQQMVHDLRCPKCQNQNLSGSNSPIAKDLRRETYRLVNEGQSDEAIKAFMVKRYGNFVLYEPPVDSKTTFIWFAPLVLFVLALLTVLMVKIGVQKRDKHATLSEQEANRLEEILHEYQ